MNIFDFNVKEYGNNYPIEKKSNIVIMVFKDSWGEVDGYLPLLVSLKHKYPKTKIITFFLSNKLVRTIKGNLVLFNEIEKVSELLIYDSHNEEENSDIDNTHRERPNFKNSLQKSLKGLFPKKLKKYIKKIEMYLKVITKSSGFDKLIRNYFANEDVRIILKDHSNDTILNRIIQKKCSKAKVVVYPHGTMIKTHNPNIKGVSTTESYVDILVAGYESERDYYKVRFPSISPNYIGHPKYDSWWLNRDSNLDFRIPSKLKTIVFFTRGPNESTLSENDYKYLVKSTIETVLGDYNNFLLVKPHPRQDYSYISKCLEMHDRSRYLITTTPPSQITRIADLVITMYSSCILDALAQRKPVIEYFLFNTENPQFLRRVNGEKYSIYEHLGVSINARNEDELKNLINDYFNPNRSAIWVNQFDVAKKVLNLENTATERFLELIIPYMKI